MAIPCSYKSYYSDFDSGKQVQYQCKDEAYSKALCKFHLKEYVEDENNKEELSELLKQKVADANASGSPLKWIGYQFPGWIDFTSYRFGVNVYLDRANFLGDAIFTFSRFERDVSFTNATFNGGAFFSNATFNEIADFSSATFNKQAQFDGDTYFNEGALFSFAQFNGSARFEGPTFKRKANFFYARFNGIAFFSATSFDEEANFSNAIFKEQEIADFSFVRFNEEANFRDAQLNKVNFSNAHFKHAEFFNVDFKDEVEFFNVEFPSMDRRYKLFDWDYMSKEEGRHKLVKLLEEIFKLNLSEKSLRTKMSRNSKTITISFKEQRTKTISLSPPSYEIVELNEEKSSTFELDEKNSRAILKSASNNNKKSYEFIAERKDDKSVQIYNEAIPIKFDHSTFRKRARFVGRPEEPIELGFVSFVGVDMVNIEFSNVNWKTKKEKLLWLIDVNTRNIIIDEEYLNKNNSNYEEVSRIYNQLRKNYETRLLFNEAANFFIGEMEAIRKSLWRRKGKWAQSIPYWIYKWLALYGESILLPLVVWTLVIIVIFIAARQAAGICALSEHNTCNMVDRAIDSISSYFQFPRSSALSSIAASNIDMIERIVSVPVLGTAFVALRRRFERAK